VKLPHDGCADHGRPQDKPHNRAYRDSVPSPRRRAQRACLRRRNSDWVDNGVDWAILSGMLFDPHVSDPMEAEAWHRSNDILLIAGVADGATRLQ
jgi:hypothetical protein